MTRSLKGKTVFITGASSGIGKSIAEAFAAEGAKLILVARRMDRLEALATELKQRHNTSLFIAEMDVRDKEAMPTVLHSLPKKFREIDILVNNAGLALGLDKVQDGDVDDWETMIDTNMKGLMYVSRAILPLMLGRNAGHIINISSMAGHVTYSKGVVYCATKAAVRAFSHGLKLDCLDTPLRVSDIGPGLVETEFSLVRFKGDAERSKKVYTAIQPLTPEDVAEAVIFVANRPAHANVAEIVLVANQQAIQLV